MKTSVHVFVAGLLLIGSLQAASAEDIHSGSNAKSKSLFVLKTQKKFIGAKVEIFQPNGEIITSQSLDRKKVVIDFGDVRLGTYLIRVTKGSETKVFQYVKK